MTKKKHSYKAKTPIMMHVEMSSHQQAEESEPTTVGELLGLSDEELAAMTREEIQEELERAVSDWASNHVSSGWWRTDGGKQ